MTTVCALSLRAESARLSFHARVQELGGTVIEPTWLGIRKPHRVLCAAGHESSPLPSNLSRGRGICPTCGRLASFATRSQRAWETFQSRVTELGGTVLEPVWLGSDQPHRVRCASGHEAAPTPSNLAAGKGICRKCSGRDPQTAWEAFRGRVAEMGGTVLEPIWLGNRTPHRARCAAGHETSLLPNNVQQGKGICLVCRGWDPTTQWTLFQARVAELGGTVLEPEYLGSTAPHRVRCSVGHVATPRPGEVLPGRRALCRACSGKDPLTAEQEFRARVTELGGTVLESEWMGSLVAHRVRCAAGHENAPTPNNVQQGGGICRKCLGMGWDVFYVVTDDHTGRVKFGITNGEGRIRLARHARDGYTTVRWLLKRLPEDLAWHLERSVLLRLKSAGMSPVKGREFFDVAALPLIFTAAGELLEAQVDRT
ncbi:hypothetical protein [Streptomyces sp. NPDC007346]|uniref:hypothetical protein n=1 Tax=Streptomyces sp. NPDC007346 TaxID=3154682 RepID=UPI003451E39B